MRAASLVLLVLICQGVGLLGGRWTVPEIPTWYKSLRKPSFNPPSWIFGPVWTTLYVLMAIAAWRILQAPGASGLRLAAMALFTAQLCLNLLWPWLFFRRHAVRAALVDLAALWIATAGTGLVFARVDLPAAWLMAPYFAWVSFAALLNGAIARLN